VPVDAVTVRVPAKVNLYLSVGRTRPDGFHDLTTVYQAVSLYDDLTVTRGGSLAVVVQGESAELVPTDESNLAVRAVRALASFADVDPDVDLSIRKGIPVAGGCAGGSADAAAALVACDELWGLGMSRAALSEIAADLGSDVPFCLAGGTALGTGRGEQLTPVLGNGHYTWVLAVVDGGLSTPAVYAELDRQRELGRVAMASDPAEVLAALRLGNVHALGRAMSNDLQDAAFGLRPELRSLLELGEDLGALAGVVSGSGPTLAFLVKDEPQGTGVAAGLLDHSACRATRVVAGPVSGARVARS
jgi:4-diphosphocytidyl-2-C-methyl-D-erythritol kinase